MKTKIIEATQDNVFYGKFLVGRFDTEWSRKAQVTGGHMGLLSQEGWTPNNLLILDLSRPCNGAVFTPGGYAKSDLEKRHLNTGQLCPLFEIFLEWLYVQDLKDLDALPDTVELEGMLERADRLRKEHEPSNA